MSLSFFVYGTLMSGEAAESMLDEVPDVTRTYAEVTQCGCVLSLPGHDGYPAAVQFARVIREPEEQQPFRQFRRGLEYTGFANMIKGEVVTVPDEHFEQVLASLDRYEGYPHLYKRQLVVANTAYRRCEAIMYYMPFNQERMQDFSVIESADWRNREDTIPFSEVMERGLPSQRQEEGLARAVRHIREHMVYQEPLPEVMEDEDDYDEDDDMEEEFG